MKKSDRSRTVQRTRDLLMMPDIMAKAIHATRTEVRRIIVSNGRVHSFRRAKIGEKELAPVDLIAETQFPVHLEHACSELDRDSYDLYGEEGLDNPDLDLSSSEKVTILVDIIDGTDLLERNFSNWCSAIVVYNPARRIIDASYVYMNTEDGDYLYYANLKGDVERYKVDEEIGDLKKDAEPRKLSIKAEKVSLKDASVCMYAQKAKNLLSLLKLSNNQAFMSFINNVASRRKDDAYSHKFRFYNFAGNPMMARMAEDRVNVVFDPTGQAPHDVVPGAYIALSAGATMLDFDGNSLNEKNLSESLLRPAKNKMKYIIASNGDLAKEMLALLNPKALTAGIPESQGEWT